MKNHTSYTTTIDLWAEGVATALHNGQLKLQKGQYVRCGQGRPSRFIRATPRSLYVVHPEGEKGITLDRFQNASRNW